MQVVHKDNELESAIEQILSDIFNDILRSFFKTKEFNQCRGKAALQFSVWH